MSLLTLLSALVAAQACPAACPSLAPAADAPSIEVASARMQAEVNLAEQHNSDAEPGIVNVTTSLTPEAEHVPTGARCRFWFGAMDVDFDFFNGRFLSCGTALGWVNAGATIFHREPRPQLHDRHYLGYARDPAAGPRDVALFRAARMEMDTPGQTSSEVSQPLVWTTPGGRRVSYAAATILYPGGAPQGTPDRRHTRLYVAEIGVWILMYSADGPVHYRAQLDGYAETGFRRLLESVEQSARILPPAPPAESAGAD